MSIRKVNARPTFKLSEVKVPGKTQPEKRKFRKLMTHDEHLNKVTALFFRENIKEHLDTRIVVPYPQEFKGITLHARSSYRHVFVSINSSGGKKGAKTRMVECSRSHLPVILGGRE